jgi:hypothetical protein
MPSSTQGASAAGGSDGLDRAISALQQAFDSQMEYLEKSVPLRTGTDQLRSSRQSG